MANQERKYTKKVSAPVQTSKKPLKKPQAQAASLSPRDLQFWERKTYNTPDGRQIIETDQTDTSSVKIAE